MRKIDILILKAFIGPFTLTTFLATFVLLLQYMMKYFDDFVGKDLGFEVFGELLFYFSLNMLQVALPLGVLVSSLMTFGNLGEHFELTAIKSAGISLVRALKPIFFFVIVLTYLAFNFNNYVVPAANLKAYSLLYDIKHKKPALDLKEGVFYNGIPDYSIKVQKKFPDNKTLKNVLIYDHSNGTGNNRVILADSSRMYTFLNERYLKLELFNGNYYSEEPDTREPVDKFYRTNFKRMDMVFNLSSFDLKRTKVELFRNNRQMKNISELQNDVDSMKITVIEAKNNLLMNSRGYYSYHMDSVDISIPGMDEVRKYHELKNEGKEDSTEVSKVLQEASFMSGLFQIERPIKQIPNRPVKELKKKAVPEVKKIKLDTLVKNPEISVAASVEDNEKALVDDSVSSEVLEHLVALDTVSMAFLNSKLGPKKNEVLQMARNQAQNVKINLSSVDTRIDKLVKEQRKYTIEKWKKYSQAFACIVMFLIGAPLGAIIKKGGLGVPVIVSIFFFLSYYIIGIIFEKSAKEGLYDPVMAAWIADFSLLPFGLFFLRQARIDARLFDTDFYNIWIDKLKVRFAKSDK
jgi:lipopolysaccharide export system permease protein